MRTFLLVFTAFLSTCAQAAPPVDMSAATATETTRLFDFLIREYGTLLKKQKDRVSRSLLVISLSRIPRADVTQTLLDLIRTETDPLVRTTAWQCVFARASLLSQADVNRWLELTTLLAEADLIRGRMRTDVLELLIATGPTPRNKALFARFFSRTDSTLPGDDPVIEAMGRCLAAWKSPEVAQALLNRLTVLDDAFRADRILNIAGSPYGPENNEYHVGSRDCIQRMYNDRMNNWWSRAKAAWREVPPAPAAEQRWQKLVPRAVPAPEALGAVDPRDKKWHRDLELRPPTLRSFDVALIVDATGSMQPALSWLRLEVKTLLAGLGATCLEPRVALTFFRDQGDEFVTRHHPLTGKINVLLDALAQTQAKGGEDLEEAVLDGLTVAAAKNPWTTQAASRKALVLIGDAPPHLDTQARCEELVRLGATQNFRTYVMKVQSPYAASDLRRLDALATAGNGVSLETTATELAGAIRREPWSELLTNYPGSEPKGPGKVPAPLRGPAPIVLPADPRPVSQRVLSALLIDAINPQFADRIEPMVAVLWDLLQDPAIEKQATWPRWQMRDDGVDMGRRRGPQDR